MRSGSVLRRRSGTALAAIERTRQAWAELQSRVRTMIRSGKLPHSLFGTLFGGLTGDQRQALDEAKQEARRYRDHPGSDEKEGSRTDSSFVCSVSVPVFFLSSIGKGHDQ